MTEPLKFDVEALEAERHRQDAKVRAQIARYEAHHRQTQAMIEMAVNIYAESLRSCWYLALNPNLGRAQSNSTGKPP